MSSNADKRPRPPHGPVPLSPVSELNERSRDILRRVVEAYVESGEPVGSRTISRAMGLALSPATIRNVMSDLEEAGLLRSPHVSAGRMPTDAGLRLFVNGLLESGGLTEEERKAIDAQCAASGRSLPQVFEEASNALSGLSRCAGLVVAPKLESTLKHVEFVPLGPGRAMVIMVSEDGQVENRVIDLPQGLPPSSLVEAANYLNARMAGRTLDETRERIALELEQDRSELDAAAQRVVAAGLATWSSNDRDGALIVRGRANLLEDVTALEDLERVRQLFAVLETKETLLRLVETTSTAQGVQIFIGAENTLFGLTGCSMVIAPYMNSREKIVGAIGVVGPTRINYARIIPLVDYTARVIGRILG